MKRGVINSGVKYRLERETTLGFAELSVVNHEVCTIDA